MSSGACTTYNTSLRIELLDAAGTVIKVIFNGYTQNGGTCTGTLVLPPSNCSSSSRSSQFGDNGVVGQSETGSVSYTPTTTADFRIRYTFTPDNGTNSGNNDDWLVTLTSSCRLVA